MTRKRDIAAMAAAVIAVLTISVIMALTSCGKELVDPVPVWATGDLPEHWTKFFGDGNGARLDYKQSQIIDELAKRVRTLEINQYIPDPNGVK